MKNVKFFIFRFPEEGFVLHAELRDQGQELLSETQVKSTILSPILGLLQTKSHKLKIKIDNTQDETNDIQNIDDGDEKSSIVPGRVVVYGDSNCIDDSHLQKRT